MNEAGKDSLAGSLYQRRLEVFRQERHRRVLGRGLRGIEREALRVDRQGQMAQTRHPRSLGSPLTNSTITTDYAEALIELITSAENDSAATVSRLDAIHRFVYHKLGHEMLWSASMPTHLPADRDILIAQYGTSHIGQLKHVYRRGLALRYGKRMQCIAGIHYNFSVADSVLAVLQQAPHPDLCPSHAGAASAKDAQSAHYFALTRNFRRYAWLLMYLFGASPAVSRPFLTGKETLALEQWDDETAYLPYATSLRMSDLGYQSNAQKQLAPLFNCVNTYIDSLQEAVSSPYPDYEKYGLRAAENAEVPGEWHQISTHVLQIENEYYATIRPKRVIESGERPLQALRERGVQYVEVRCMDINPFLPLGIDVTTSRFLDAFLTFCLLHDSPAATVEEARENDANFAAVATEGRRTGLMLTRQGNAVTLTDWANELLDQIAQTVSILDVNRGDTSHADSLAQQRRKVADVSLTPSARVLEEMRVRKESFSAFSLRLSRDHASYFLGHPPAAEDNRRFTEQAAASLDEQSSIERNQRGTFDDYMARYRAAVIANESLR